MHLNDINEFLLQDNLFRNKIINESNETNAQRVIIAMRKYKMSLNTAIPNL